MTYLETHHSDDISSNRIFCGNNILNFIRKSILSKPIYLDGRSDNNLISACWSTYRFFRKRETRHSEKLNQSYIKIKKLSLEEKEHKIYLNEDLDDISYFSHAMSHLKSYKEDYRCWTNLNALIEEHNSLIEEIEPILRKQIRNEAKDNEYYPDYTAVITKPDSNMKNINFYNLTGIFEYAFNYLYKYEDQEMLISDFVFYGKTLVTDIKLIKK